MAREDSGCHSAGIGFESRLEGDRLLVLCHVFPRRMLCFKLDVVGSGRSRDSVDGIATGYGLEDRGVGVRVPVRSRIFSSLRHPDRLCGPPSLLSNGYLGAVSPGVKR
jgi:hypothetical protein